MNDADLAAVTELLGREPQGGCEVAVRGPAGEPVVIRNEPHLRDGRPMPTLYWLVGRSEQEAVSRLEAEGGVRAAERQLAEEEVEAAHRRYAAERTALGAEQGGRFEHEASGGVGGTRRGVKCLHAHLAYFLAGGDDPVGRWTAAHAGIDPERYTVVDGAVHGG